MSRTFLSGMVLGAAFIGMFGFMPRDEMPASDFTSVGSVVIMSQKPDSVAAWYAEKLELATPIKHQGGHYGGFATADGPLHFGVMPYPEGMPVSRGGGMAVTFRVKDFDRYLARVKARGLQPIMEHKDHEGRFATFIDPEGNAIGIWGK